jgi:hypothetical protein
LLLAKQLIQVRQFVELNTEKVREQIKNNPAPWAFAVRLATYGYDKEAAALSISLNGYNGVKI